MMNADEYILKLPNITLHSRELLPEKSGIYYVVDENNLIWYVGQAKNLRNRWLGENHHRLDQLQKQRKKQFTIYYELVIASMLDILEKQRIEQYHPQLNGTRVNSKKLHPTETLLRETLIAIAPYSFILGVEPPRKEDIELIEYSKYWRDKWRIHKSVLPLQVIHICINLTELVEVTQDKSATIRFLKKIFRKRINFSDNWHYQGDKKLYRLSDFLLRRLLVNGFAIEIYEVCQEVLSHIQSYTIVQLAGVNIKTVNSISLENVKNKCLINNIAGLYLKEEKYNNSSYIEIYQRSISKLEPYKEDLIKILFNENIDTKKLVTLPLECQSKEIEKNSLSVKLVNLTNKKEFFKKLLIELSIDLNKYQVNKYLESIPRDNNYYESNNNSRMIVYVKSFLYENLQKSIASASLIYGQRGITYQSSHLSNTLYEQVYLAVTVNKAFWLLFENYLFDFTKVTLNEDEGYVSKYYISQRKILKPALLSVNLDRNYKANIPIGPKDNMSYSQVVEVIKNRLNNSVIPNLKFSFKLM